MEEPAARKIPIMRVGGGGPGRETMAVRRTQRTGLATTVALALIGSAAAAPATRPDGAPGGYRCSVARITQNQVLTLEFAGATPTATARQTVWITLAVDAPTPNAALAIAGLGADAIAETPDGERVTVFTQPGEPATRLEGRRWEGYLVLPEVDGGVDRLRRLAGQLLAYRQAEVVRLEFPLGQPVPRQRAWREYQVELRSIGREGSRLTAEIVVRWPAGLSVTRWGRDSPYGIRAESRHGIPLPYHEAGSEPLRGRGEGHGWRYRMTWDVGSEPPARIVVEALVRSGRPETVPFELREVLFPSARPIPGEPPEPDAEAPLPATFHYRAPGQGGAIVLATSPPRSARFAIGLSRWEAGGWGPWRWAYLAADPQGRAVVAPLLPGRYRVQLLGCAGDDPAREVWRGGREPLVVEVRAGEPIALPPLTVEESPQ